MNLVQAILAKNFVRANEILESKLKDKVEIILIEEKKMLVTEMYDEELEEIPIDLTEARFRIVKARIRNGKVQRRKKVSNIKGYTFRKKGKGPAKLTRMSPQERRKRKLGQRRGKIKRRMKLARIRQKQRRSLRKRKALGIR